MNLILHLTPDTEKRLMEWASLSGKNLEAVALEAIQEKLSHENGPLPQALSSAEFRSWFASHPCSAAAALDDSRESIYKGRGE